MQNELQTLEIKKLRNDLALLKEANDQYINYINNNFLYLFSMRIDEIISFFISPIFNAFYIIKENLKVNNNFPFIKLDIKKKEAIELIVATVFWLITLIISIFNWKIAMCLIVSALIILILGRVCVDMVEYVIRSLFKRKRDKSLKFSEIKDIKKYPVERYTKLSSEYTKTYLEINNLISNDKYLFVVSQKHKQPSSLISYLLHLVSSKYLLVTENNDFLVMLDLRKLKDGDALIIKNEIQKIIDQVFDINADINKTINEIDNAIENFINNYSHYVKLSEKMKNNDLNNTLISNKKRKYSIMLININYKE